MGWDLTGMAQTHTHTHTYTHDNEVEIWPFAERRWLDLRYGVDSSGGSEQATDTQTQSQTTRAQSSLDQSRQGVGIYIDSKLTNLPSIHPSIHPTVREVLLLFFT